MLTELRYIRNALLRIIIVFFVLAFVFLTVTIPPIHGTVAAWGVEAIRTNLIPPNATLAVMSPLDPFFALASLAAALATGLIIPFFMWELWRFAAPALTPQERATLASGLVGACVLALLGGVFAYRVLIPLIFAELYAFLPQGVLPLFNLRIVLAQVTALTLGTALMFLLPLLMVLLTWARLVSVRTWSTYMRHAVLLVLVASAIITPDGSGVGMMLLATPVCALYGVGYMGAKLTDSTNN
jgi:sec-independent protein translocase protein TatC